MSRIPRILARHLRRARLVPVVIGLLAVAALVAPVTASASTMCGTKLSEKHSTGGWFPNSGTFTTQACLERLTGTSLRGTLKFQVIGDAGLHFRSYREELQFGGAVHFVTSCAITPPITYSTTYEGFGGYSLTTWRNNYVSSCGYATNVLAGYPATYTLSARQCFDIADDGKGTFCTPWSVTSPV